MDLPHSQLIANDKSVSFVMVDQEPWFRANDVALVMSYAKPAWTVSRLFRGRLQKYSRSLAQLLTMGISRWGVPKDLDGNDRKTTYINERGVYRLVMKSNMPMAQEFQDWLYEDVLPTIRKTGAYSLPASEPQACHDEWVQERLDGIHLTKLKNASIKKLIACCVGGEDGRLLYAVINGAINRTLLNFDDSTSSFMKRNRLPGYMSIPEFLAYDGQLLRKQMERTFIAHIKRHWSDLQAMSMEALTADFNAMGKRMREGNLLGNYTVPLDDLLTADEAESRKRSLAAARVAGLELSRDTMALAQPAKRQNTLKTSIRPALAA